MNIVIAGASGFIGSELMKELPSAYGISRNEPKTERWIYADLFSRSLCEKALKNCNVAIYLVHSMLPTSHLDQGDFQDFDLIIADNFSRACRINGVKQIIYLGGLIPDVTHEDLSSHLKSRKEVEKVLKSSLIPLTTLRCGLIIGSRGSSFNILKNLASRLPIMIYPPWLSKKMEPVGLNQVIESIKYCINNPETFNRCFDIGGGEKISYKGLISLTRQVMHKKSLQFQFFIPKFIVKYWISLISGAPQNLISPLISSLKHNMITSDNNKLTLPNFKPTPLKQLLTAELCKSSNTPHAFKARPHNRVVRSIQRVNANCLNDVKVYQLYFDWLVKFFNPFLKVENNNKVCIIKLLGFPLLMLELLKDNSNESRELLSIKGGLLVSKSQKYGRIEFRKFPDCIIIAIHDYMPSLPWYFYIMTQALIHKFVMRQFSKYLVRTKLCSKGQ